MTPDTPGGLAAHECDCAETAESNAQETHELVAALAAERGIDLCDPEADHEDDPLAMDLQIIHDMTLAHGAHCPGHDDLDDDDEDEPGDEEGEDGSGERAAFSADADDLDGLDVADLDPDRPPSDERGLFSRMFAAFKAWKNKDDASAIQTTTADFAREDDPGVMIALYPPAELAEELAEPDGESADELHVTLCYLGRISEVGSANIDKIERAVRMAANGRRPLSGTIGGRGRFPASVSSDGMGVLYANVDVPGLVELRQEIVRALAQSEISIKTNHGFTPHMTLNYVEPDSPLTLDELESKPVTFDAVWLCMGDDRRRIGFTSNGESGIWNAAVSMFEADADVIVADETGSVAWA